MNTTATKTIRDIALEAPETTRVFEEFKIDYCCGGKKSLEQACEKAGLDPTVVSAPIESAISDRSARAGAGDVEKRSPSADSPSGYF